MLRQQLFGLMMVCGFFASLVQAADDAPKIMVAQGLVEKVEKDVLTIKPRGADGKFGKSIVLKLTGTSHFSTVSSQKRGDKLVLVQKELEAKNLTAKHSISVIYAENAEDLVVLSAVTRDE